jgi:phosphoribosyl 1,2-cyclic phosphate phosphodiesterase
MTLKIKILGSGSAYGVPYFGGNWGDCNPNNPKNRRSTASILIEQGKTKILVDMGYDILRQSEKHMIRELDAVIFTHTHADHIVGNFHVPIMMSYYHDRDLDFYADDFTRGGIEKMWWFQYDQEKPANFYGPRRVNWKEIKPFEPMKIGEIDITPIPLNHGGMTSMGLRIGNFAYCTDLNEISEEAFAQLQGLDVWLLECDSLKLSDEKHSYLEKSLNWIERVKPKQAFLTHLDHTIDFDAVTKRLPQNVGLAYDDQIIEI